MIEEQIRTYSTDLLFNQNQINKTTITDHYEEKHKKMITDKLIIKLLEEKLNGKKIKPLPESYLWGKDVFRFETIYRGRKYRVIFWFKVGTTDHLWIRNCYPVN